MRHPKDRSGVTRKQLLRGAAAAVGGAGAVAALAACQNTTTAIGACEDGTGEGTVAGGDGGGLASNLVVAKPTGPGGLPLPRTDNSVTWAITDDNQPITGRPASPRPGRCSSTTTPTTSTRPRSRVPEAVLDARSRSRRTTRPTRRSRSSRPARSTFDVIVGLTRREHRRPDRAQAAAAAQPRVPAQPREEHLARAAGPVLRPRQSRYTVPYVVWMDGIGWRNDKVDEDIARAWTSPGTSSGSPRPYRGKVGILDDKRDALSMPMQRDAMRGGCVADLNTEDPELVAKAGRDLAELSDICNMKVTITDYQTLPEGKTGLHHSWSGDLLARRSTTCRRARRSPRCSRTGGRRSGVVQNDFFCIAADDRRSPCSRTRSSTSCSTRRTRTTTSSTTIGYTPPQKSDRRRGADQSRA